MTDLTIPAVSATTSPDEIIELIKIHGGVRVFNLVDESVMDRLEEELWSTIETTPGGPDDFLGTSTRRVSGLVGKSKTAGELALNPLVNAVIERGLGPFQLHVSQAICLMPGETAQPLHRDDLVYPEAEHPLEKELVMNVLWAVREFTEEIGGTRAIPGSHKWDDVREPDPAQSIATVMPRGSALIYFGSMYHGGGANQSKDKVRFAASMAYSRNWLRQEENQYLAIPPSVAKNLPEELQKLIGYSKLGFLGWVDLEDPMDLMKSGQLG